MSEPKEATRTSALPWLLGQTGEQKSRYLASVLVAVLGVASRVAPYFVVANVISHLMAGERDVGYYLRQCGLIAVFWALQVLFHAISTAISHKATFAVLGDIRKRCTDKLARMPLGDVLDQPSGALKSTIVERIDAMETTLAHIVPEFTSNLLAPICLLICLFAADWRMALAALVTVPLVTVLPVGCLLVKGGSLSAETFVYCIILSLAIIDPLITCMSYTDDIGTMSAIVAEVRNVLDAPEMQRPNAAEKLPADNTLELTDVHFAYHEKEVLHGVSLTIPQGSVTALVGPSGSGKSTIARLISSLWDVKSGKITLGGVDLKDLPLDELNNRIAYVSQDNYLFNRSIRENIRMGRKDATDAEVEDAAKRSVCHEFILGLEYGYDTVVGSSGGHLSGGERQRITIARAMLKNAPIVILDEATANVDPENEDRLQKAIEALTCDKTIIMIAHRLKTVRHADQILIVDHGRIVQQGKHEELMKQPGIYADFVGGRKQAAGWKL